MNFKQWLETDWSSFGNGGESDEDLQKYIDIANLWKRGMTWEKIGARYGVSGHTARKWGMRSLTTDQRPLAVPSPDDWHNPYGQFPVNVAATPLSQLDNPRLRSKKGFI